MKLPYNVNTFIKIYVVLLPKENRDIHKAAILNVDL